MEIEELYQEFLASEGVSTDTRQDVKGKLFFALKGPNYDANAFAREALAKGARLAVVDDQDQDEAQGMYFVDDALASLQALAAHHRKQLKATFIAICGSNGKTTTKELLSRVLATRYKTYATQGNLNNHIGVPLTVLSITDRHEMAVIEIGANHAGETALLCKIADPDFGLITNIGKDHLEGFGSVEGVAEANGELFEHLKGNKGLAFVNTNQPLVMAQATRLSRRVTYPNPNDFFPLRGDLDGLYLRLRLPDAEPVTTKLPGLYNLDNVAAALCVGKYFDVNPEAALAAVAAYSPANNRSQIVDTGRNIVMADAYNANPSSMLAALQNLALLNGQGRGKAVILGDMAELGVNSRQEHFQLGEELARIPLERTLLIGPLMAEAARACHNARHFNDAEALIHYLAAEPLQNSLVLLKASRSAKLEQLLATL